LQTVIAASYLLLQLDGQEDEAGGAVGTQAARVANPRTAVIFVAYPLRARRYRSRGSGGFALAARGIVVHPPVTGKTG